MIYLIISPIIRFNSDFLASGIQTSTGTSPASRFRFLSALFRSFAVFAMTIAPYLQAFAGLYRGCSSLALSLTFSLCGRLTSMRLLHFGLLRFFVIRSFCFSFDLFNHVSASKVLRFQWAMLPCNWGNNSSISIPLDNLKFKRQFFSVFAVFRFSSYLVAFVEHADFPVCFNLNPSYNVTSHK